MTNVLSSPSMQFRGFPSCQGHGTPSRTKGVSYEAFRKASAAAAAALSGCSCSDDGFLEASWLKQEAAAPPVAF